MCTRPGQSLKSADPLPKKSLGLRIRLLWVGFLGGLIITTNLVYARSKIFVSLNFLWNGELGMGFYNTSVFLMSAFVILKWLVRSLDDPRLIEKVIVLIRQRLKIKIKRLPWPYLVLTFLFLFYFVSTYLFLYGDIWWLK